MPAGFEIGVSASLTLLLATVFLVALVTKVAAWETTLEWITLLRIPSPVPVTILALVGEGCVVALLVLEPRVGGIAAAAWLLAATGVLWRARSLGLGCACFGRPEPPSSAVFVRNLMLIFTGVAVAALPSADRQSPLTAVAVGTLVSVVLAGREWATSTAS